MSTSEKELQQKPSPAASDTPDTDTNNAIEPETTPVEAPPSNPSKPEGASKAAPDSAKPAQSESVTGADKPTLVKISDIEVDPSIQVRVETNPDTVDEYAERMRQKDQFPPITTFKVDGKLLLVDGSHRLQAAQKAGLKEIQAVVRSGSRRDAIKHAIAANTAHGLPRTNKDKERAVRLALSVFGKRSDHFIADLVKVSQPFVSKVRKLKTVISSEPRTGRDGKERKLPTAKTPSKEDADQVAPKEPTIPRQASTESNSEPRGTDNGTEGREIEPVSEPPDSAPGQEGDLFDPEMAWCQLSGVLRDELERWPASHRHVLGDKLRRFAECNCGEHPVENQQQQAA